MAGLTGKSNSRVDCHIDVTEDDGLIIIPYKEIPQNWTGAPDIRSYCSLDRNFVFAGEQVQVLVCLSANKKNIGTITPLKNGTGHRSSRQNGKVVQGTNQVSKAKDPNTDEQNNQNGEAIGKIDSQEDVSICGCFPRMEDHRRLTDQLLQRFKNSHFFARIAESNEPLWSRRSVQECLRSSETSEKKFDGDSSEAAKTLKTKNPISVVIDRGKFDDLTSGGVARGAAECCSLSNGDIVVLLQVKVGVEFMTDPILEILQFEKNHERDLTLENQHILTSFSHDPCGKLLNWLLPVNNPRRPLPRPSSSILNSSSSIHSTSTKSTVSAPSGSELFSFGHVRSYSMSSLQPNKRQQPQGITAPYARPSFVPEDQDQFSFWNLVESGKSGNEGLLSFRGVSLLPERFYVQCGLEGIFTPGRRWRRKFELIQPLEIHSSFVDCNTDDLLCVRVKNVSPAHAPDVVVFIDSITIVFEEAAKGGQPLPLPIACTEAGDGCSLPSLALRRGEEHSFILKPATMLLKHPKGQTDSNSQPPCLSARTARSSWHPSFNIEWGHSGPPDVQYGVVVSCRCNYTESKLFFKHPISWRPRIARDLLISVASEVSRQTLASDGTQLPIQVLTLQASNMTSDDLTLTVLAPVPFITPPSLVSLSPLGAVVHGLSSVSLNQGQNTEDGPQSASIIDQPVPFSNVVPNSDPSCTHLWLKSRVPLGCVPSHSTATIKLELLPLMGSIITLDSLRIDVKEKGLIYMPKHALKINATADLPLVAEAHV